MPRQNLRLALLAALVTVAGCRNDADKPEAFIASTALVLPRASSKGWVAFDGQLAFVPSQLSYVDTGQVLTVQFDGKHRVT